MIFTGSIIMSTPVLLDNPPRHIWYADKLLNQGGEPREITIAEFQRIYAEKTHSNFQYTETVWYDSASRISHEKYKSHYSVRLANEVKQMLHSPSINNIVICYVNEQVGFAAYARKSIAAFSTIAVYAGDLVPDKLKDRTSSYLLSAKPGQNFKDEDVSDSVDAKTRGGIARFFAHLPHCVQKLQLIGVSPDARLRILDLLGLSDQPGLSDLIMINDGEQFAEALYDKEKEHSQQPLKEANVNNLAQAMQQIQTTLQTTGINLQGFRSYVQNKLKVLQKHECEVLNSWHSGITTLLSSSTFAIENLGRNTTVIDGVPVPFFYAKRDISAGELLGFDYGFGYWIYKACLPLLFKQTGEILPKEEYRYKLMPLMSDHYLTHDVNQTAFICHYLDYFEHVSSQLPMQLCILEKPRSFFKIRDLLVENNILPMSHGALNSVYVAEYLQRIFAVIPQVVVKAYYHDPDTSDALEKYTVDVVCRFPEWRQWANFTEWLTKQPIRQYTKCYQFSGEIIFRGVNIPEIQAMMQTLCQNLQNSRRNLPQWFNKDNASKQPFSDRGFYYQDPNGQYVAFSY